LIVDDHALYREALTRLFETAPGVGEVATAAGGDEAVRRAERFQPDVVLIVMGLQAGQAFRAGATILSRCAGSHILYLDDSVDHTHVSTTLRLGGSGYWTKHAEFKELADAVRRVAAGQLAFCPTVQKHLVRTLRGLRFQPVPEDSVVDKLTPREREVLVHLAGGLSVKQCAERMCLAKSTVDNHKSRLMKKLGVHKVVDLVRLAIREGLVEG